VKRHPELAKQYDQAQSELMAKLRELDALAKRIRDAITAELATGASP